MNFFSKPRIDYILIWGHALNIADLILNEIRQSTCFSIKKIIYHKPKNTESLIRVIYSNDYAPIEHLKSKTEYLKKTPNEVIFIFIENKDPDIDFMGKGSFRHIESLTLKRFKENIRDKYNSKEGGMRSENHVIHTSNNEEQTDYILKYLGLYNGVRLFESQNDVIIAPYYIKKIKKLCIRLISIDSLICNIVTGKSRYNYSIEKVKLRESPQYKGLSQDISYYKSYIDKFIGGPLTEDYYPEKLTKLAKELNYSNCCNDSNYILVKKLKNNFLILDGLHRASILAYRGERHLIVAEVVE